VTFERKTLDSRFRGNDDMMNRSRFRGNDGTVSPHEGGKRE